MHRTAGKAFVVRSTGPPDSPASGRLGSRGAGPTIGTASSLAGGDDARGMERRASSPLRGLG